MNKIELNRWVKSLVYMLIIFALFSTYLYLRRGYYNLYIINKVFGSTAVVLAGITLIVRPLSQKFKYLVQIMTIRRNLGILAFIMALFHTIASLVQQKRFLFPDWYLKEIIPVIAGILALTIWVYMTYISRNSMIKKLGVEIWKKRLSRAGMIAFVLIFIHISTMKYEGWLRWINGKVIASPELKNPNYIPASILVFLVILVIFGIRIFNKPK